MSEEVNLQIQNPLGKIVDFIGIPSQDVLLKRICINYIFFN